MRRLIESIAAKTLCLLVVATAANLTMGLESSFAAFHYKLKTLHQFCRLDGCPDGTNPEAPLLMGSSGDLYGTAPKGGAHGNNGTVFRIVNNGTKWITYILYNFCAQTRCADGAVPSAPLIMDVDGNLYGTTEAGGKHGVGTVFKLTHGSKGWSESVVHDFCLTGVDCDHTDGYKPVTGLIYSGQRSGQPWNKTSPLFGTTWEDQVYYSGVVYKLVFSGGRWTETVIHQFKTSGEPSSLVMDSAGNLFGIAQGGGSHDEGMIYRLAQGTWKETILHNFCSQANCSDGRDPGNLTIDAAGNLFGTTYFGGNDSDAGVAFERPSGGAYKVLHRFCSWASCEDGKFPNGVTVDGSGHLFGTTQQGGSSSCNQECGTVFLLSNSDGSWSETVIHEFCLECGSWKGGTPFAPVIVDDTGRLFGTTSEAGEYDNGTVFLMKP